MSAGRKIYLWLGLALSPLAILGLRAYTKITSAPRVRVIVENESGKILLLKNVLSADNKWTLPGGGVGRQESYLVAAQRELREETGIIVALDTLKVVATLQPSESGLHYAAPILKTKCASLNLPAVPYNVREIAAVGWFSPKDLPNDTAELVHRALKAANIK